MTYIAPSKAFAHLDRLARWRDGHVASPVTIEWDLSNRCVLGCQDCHFAHTHVKGPWASKGRILPLAYDSTGDLADADLVRRTLGEMAAIGVQGVIWSGGGEPTTHPMVYAITEHAARLGLQQGMYTLGGLLTLSSAARLAKALTWAVVSLDCVNAETYAAEKGVHQDRFADACTGIQALATFNLPTLGVSFLLHRDNWQQAEAMHALARELGATYTTFRPAIRASPATPSVCVDDRAWITDALPMLRALSANPTIEVDADRFAEYRDWAGHGYGTCHGIKLTSTITPDGRVWVCPQRRGIAGSCLGDLRREAFADIWQRQTGRYEVDSDCRVMCRLHLMNQQINPVFTTYAHEAFV